MGIEKGTTQYAIIEMIENPPAQWKDVIHTHFRMQSARVMKNVTKWHGEDHQLTKKVQSLLEGLQDKKAESPLVAPALEKKTSDGAYLRNTTPTVYTQHTRVKTHTKKGMTLTMCFYPHFCLG